MICYFTLIFQSFNDISLCIKIVDHCFNDDNVEGTWNRPSCRSGDRLVTVSVKRMLIICPSWMTSCGLTFWTHSYWHARWIWRQLLRLFINILSSIQIGSQDSEPFESRQNDWCRLLTEATHAAPSGEPAVSTKEFIALVCHRNHLCVFVREVYRSSQLDQGDVVLDEVCVHIEVGVLQGERNNIQYTHEVYVGFAKLCLVWLYR